MGMCWRLANYEAMVGDWSYINDFWEAYKAVTAEDIMRVANKYLNKSNRTVATLVKPDKDKSEESLTETESSSY